MNSPQEKGDALELAVAAIEHVILHNAPSVNEIQFERKKRINAGGVHHEIDLFLTIDSGGGYKSVFIFECKNWQDAVNKNEIIIFSKKIQDSSATMGYFVAKAYTSDAMAAARLDPRIVLYTAIEHDPTKEATEFYCRFPHMLKFQATFTVFDSKGQEYKTENIDQIQIKYRGQIVKLQEQFVIWSTEACDEDFAAFFEEPVPEGIYPRPSVHKIRKFARGELFFDDREIEHATLRIEYCFEVVKSPLVSHFEVETRGRCYSFAPLKREDGVMQFNLVLMPHNNSGDVPEDQ
jgi:hypothetical protein